MNQVELLTAISEWQLEAGDDLDKYFLPTKDYEAIKNGKKIFVIGRKGTGKTAICEHLHNSKQPNAYSIMQSFKNFPFNELYKFSDSNFAQSNQYISVWKYVILTALCRLMTENRKIDHIQRDRLKKIFNFKLDEAFSRRLRKITDRSFGLNFAGFGATTESAQNSRSFAINLTERCDFLEDYVRTHLDDSSYYILFDGLDDDYKDIITIDNSNTRYFELLKGLFKASQELHRSLNKEHRKVYPIVFIRNDIYDLIQDNDKSKWRDKSIDLKWNSTSLKEMMAHRISKSINSSGPVMSFSNAWPLVFSNDEIGFGTRKRKKVDQFEYLLRCTYSRPRDLISYVRECAVISLEREMSRADNGVIIDAELEHSHFMLEELVSEVHSLIPEISDIMDMFSAQRKQVFGREEFNRNYRGVLKKIPGKKAALTTTKILEILHHFSIIGNTTKGNHRIFKYSSPRTRYNSNEAICVHRCLYKALEIS